LWKNGQPITWPRLRPRHYNREMPSDIISLSAKAADAVADETARLMGELQEAGQVIPLKA